ncbi:Sphingolipid C9-methyltransferase 2, variant 2 [Aspergillus fumigatus]
MTKIHPESPEDFEYIETPPASCTTPADDCGVRTTSYPAIKNAPVPADAAGSDSFSNILLFSLLLFVPWYLARQVGGGFYTTIFFAIFTTVPILMVFWSVASSISPRKNEKAKYAGRPVEHYLHFHNEHDRATYRGKSKIPMEVFYEKYFNGEVDFKGDALEALEFRHDWANFRFTMGLYKHFLFGFIPELLVHSRSQDEEQVRDHYDRGDDFYAWFLGPRMIYTSGIISDINKEETLEELQDNKLAVVCEKINVKPGDTILDLGCGWGTLAKFASVHYGAHVTGITLGRNQTAWGNKGLRSAGIPESQSRILCLDYRDAPRVEGGYKKITCLEMAEHVGVRHFGSFLSQVYEMLDDDGVFFLQIAGLRKSWQYEDLIWGLFMNKALVLKSRALTLLVSTTLLLFGAGTATGWVTARRSRPSTARDGLESGSTSWPTQPSSPAREALPAGSSPWSRTSTPPTVLRVLTPSTASRVPARPPSTTWATAFFQRPMSRPLTRSKLRIVPCGFRHPGT